MTDLDRIGARLGALGRRLRRAAMVETAQGCAAVFLFCFGVSVILAEAGWVRTGAGAFFVAATGAVLLWIWLVQRGATALKGRYITAQAQLAEELAPELGTAPSSAVDLGRQLGGTAVRFSRSLAEAHLRATADALNNVALELRLQRERRPRRRWTAITLGAAALWAVIMVGGLDKGRTRLATLLLRPGAAQLSDVPLAGDIRITYNYPTYTGLPARIVEGGDGSISAVVGTEVEIIAKADAPPRNATLRLDDLAGGDTQNVPMVVDGRTLRGKLPVLRDGRYHFALTNEDGERLEDRQQHPIRAVLDTYPEVYLDEPQNDIELKDDRSINILWRARDDFGVPEVNLVIEPGGAGEPLKLPLSLPGDADSRLEGRYQWMVSELDMEPGAEARFYIEAFDNDATGGPKRSVSASRRLVLFSAKANHGKLLARQQEALDALVDWLAGELVAPFPSKAVPDVAHKLAEQRKLLDEVFKVASTFMMLVTDLAEDRMTKPEIVAAFENLLEHINTTRQRRGGAIERASAPQAGRRQYMALAAAQTRDISQLEKDIIYLDDLLAVQRIDELKETAKDLLAAQRQLQDMLQRYKQTQDPTLRAELEQRIAELRQKMMSLLAKMAEIKDRLPGEYRNLESAAMLQMGDQLERLERMLREGDLEAAAAELEQLASMIENMVDSINNAEEEYGGERYAEMRKQLQDFAQQFKELEDQQQALAKRTQNMLSDYRKKSIERAGKDLDSFINKARRKTGEALEALEEMAAPSMSGGLFGVQNDLDQAHQRLLDLDALLEHRDFAEAREMVQQAQDREENIDRILRSRMGRHHDSSPEMRQAARSTDRAIKRTDEVADMLDKLFPDPAEVLTPQQMAQMQRMEQKQRDLEGRAGKLGQKMDEMAQQMPLFGGEPRQNLDAARQEMGQAGNRIGEGQLPKAAGHEQRAVEQLGKLRQALEQATQRSGGKGLPLPLGGSARGQRDGNGSANSQRDVEIPKTDPNRSGADFRENLREASKQKPPQRFEEAVQKYYRELIR